MSARCLLLALVVSSAGGCVSSKNESVVTGTSASATSTIGGSISTGDTQAASTSSSPSAGTTTASGFTSAGTTTGTTVGGTSQSSSAASSTTGESSVAGGSTSNGATSTGGSSGAGTTSGSCASTEFGPQQSDMPGCSTDGDCLCGQWCVNDPNDIPLSRICETPCTSNSECSNAASHCTNEAVPVNPAHAGNTCTVNNCHGLHPGGACDVTAAGAMDGTCVPFDGWTVMGFAVCILNGTATTCTEGTTNDDPLLAQPNGSSNGEIIISPQSKADGDVLCGAGQGCYVANR